eukprot:COSAG05_NODE_2462_length_3031_cov_10.605048_4_plen_30_part_01
MIDSVVAEFDDDECVLTTAARARSQAASTL